MSRHRHHDTRDIATLILAHDESPNTHTHRHTHTPIGYSITDDLIQSHTTRCCNVLCIGSCSWSHLTSALDCIDVHMWLITCTVQSHYIEPRGTIKISEIQNIHRGTQECQNYHTWATYTIYNIQSINSCLALTWHWQYLIHVVQDDVIHLN